MVLINRNVVLRLSNRLSSHLLKIDCLKRRHISSVSTERIVARSKEELDAVKKLPFSQPADAKVLTVSVLGSPNAGKSTLTNALLGWRVCSVSQKVHTTKRNTKAVLTEDNTQIVFLDTPGLVSLTDKRKHRLEMNMVVDPGLSLNKADLIIVLVDVTNVWTRHKLDTKIIELLDSNRDKVAILVLNKVDVIKSKTVLLELTRLLTEGVVAGQSTHMLIKKRPPPQSLEHILRRTEKSLGEQSYCVVSESEKTDKEEQEDGERRGWPHFRQVFMVSALTGDGVQQLKSYLLDSARSGSWLTKPHMVTDQSPQEIAVLAVREKLLDKLPKQIPYDLKLTIEMWEVESDVLKIFMKIGCPERRYMKIVIGPVGKSVSSVADAARQELMNTFRCEVSLKLAVEYEPRKHP